MIIRSVFIPRLAGDRPSKPSPLSIDRPHDYVVDMNVELVAHAVLTATQIVSKERTP